MPKSSHIHTYKRVNLRANKSDPPYFVYKCQRMLCQHYLPGNLLEGKLAECPRCDKPFKLEKKHLSLVEPHCDDCYIKRVSV